MGINKNRPLDQVITDIQKCTNMMKMEVQWAWWENSPFPWTSTQTTNWCTFISQSNYANGIIHKLGMDSIKPCSTLMRPSTYIDKDEKGISFDEKRCWGMINSLLYVIANRFGIMFNVCICDRYQSSPKESYLKACECKYCDVLRALLIWDFSILEI